MNGLAPAPEARSSATEAERLLALLRAAQPRHAIALNEALRLAEYQAWLLRKHLGPTGPAISDSALRSIPFIQVIESPHLEASGSSTRVGSAFLVGLRADEPRTRQRFTLGHEIKHVIDDHDIDWLYAAPAGLDLHARIGQICDRFAAALLMPAPSLRRDWIGGIRSVARLARRYDVSSQAMERRLRELGLVRPLPRCTVLTERTP